MLSKGEDVEAYALKERGRPVLAIARHLGRYGTQRPSGGTYLVNEYQVEMME